MRLGEGSDGQPASVIALDTFNEPHLSLPGCRLRRSRSRSRRRPASCSGRHATRSSRPRPSSTRCDGPPRGDRPGRLRQGRHAHRVRPDVERLGRGARVATSTAATGRSFDEPLFAMLGFDAGDGGRSAHGGGLDRDADGAPARARPATCSNVSGLSRDEADAALAGAWHAPDPGRCRSPARPTCRALFGRPSRLRAAHRHRDQRRPRAHSSHAGGPRRGGRRGGRDLCADDGVAGEAGGRHDRPPLRSPRRGAGPDGGRRRFDRRPVDGSGGGRRRSSSAFSAGSAAWKTWRRTRTRSSSRSPTCTSRATSPRAVNQNAGARGTPASRAWRSSPSCGRP